MTEEKVEVVSSTEENELERLRKEVAELKAEKEKQDPGYLDKRIDELVEKRLESVKTEEDKRIEEAREILRKAKENEELEKRFKENEKYNNIEAWTKNKEKELVGLLDRIAREARNGNYPLNFYKGLQENKGKRDLARLIYLSQKFGGEACVAMMKRKFHVI